MVCLIETYTSADEIVLVFEPCMLGDLYQVLHSNSRTLDEDFVCRQVRGAAHLGCCRVMCVSQYLLHIMLPAMSGLASQTQPCF